MGVVRPIELVRAACLADLEPGGLRSLLGVRIYPDAEVADNASRPYATLAVDSCREDENLRGRKLGRGLAEVSAMIVADKFEDVASTFERLVAWLSSTEAIASAPTVDGVRAVSFELPDISGEPTEVDLPEGPAHVAQVPIVFAWKRV